MSDSYFTPENAMHRFFYLQGLTSDEFYTDSGMCVDLEWLLFKELQRNGYERIIYYDRDWKLYCFDAVSMDLMLRGRRAKEEKNERAGLSFGSGGVESADVFKTKKTAGESRIEHKTGDKTESKRESRTAEGRGGGLKKGKWGKKKHTALNTRFGGSFDTAEESKESREHKESKESKESERPEVLDEEQEKKEFRRGKQSGIWMQWVEEKPLHAGLMDNEMVYRQIDACMKDVEIKTAVVINDAGDFIRDLGDNRQHNLQNYTKLPASNQNIMIFIYSDQQMLSLLETPTHIRGQSDQQSQAMSLERMSQVISVYCPNALELCNMLNYFRLAPNLRVDGKKVNLNVRMTEILDIALELKRCMSEGEKSIGIKQLYHKLLRYAATGQQLTAENCYQLFGEKRHLTGEQQIQRLIGMENVKKELLKFRGHQTTSEDKVRYLTSSRLRPNLPVPERKEMMHVVLTGNPGTGKTTVARLLGQLYFEMGYLSSGHVVETDREGLVAGYVGQTAIKTRAKVQDALGGVLFIDEAYALKREENTSGGDFGQEAIDTLVKAMDEFKGQFIVVAAGYKKQMETFLHANPGLSSRFRLHLHMENYTPKEMRQILEMYLAERDCRFSENMQEQLDTFCENWVSQADENWGNAREAVNLVADLELNWKNDVKHETRILAGKEWKILEERHLPQEKRVYLISISKMREAAMEELNRMPGLAYVKQQVEKIRKRMIMGDITTPGHYVFVGNPGTGKTMVARQMGQILRNHGLLKRGHLEEYTAGTLVNLVSRGKSFAELAEKALDGVLFIDEAYQLLNSAVGEQVILDLLTFIESNRERLCVICAGYEEDMERFLAFNAGLKDRFSEVILFENYSGEELCSILELMLQEKGYQADEKYLEYSLRALTRYVDIHGSSRLFGNARYIREHYLIDSLDARNERLFKEYGEAVPAERKKWLTGADIPKALVKYTREKLPAKDTRSAMEKIDELVGYVQIKKELRVLLNAAKYRREDGSGAKLIPETLHWVLKGNPGTGKTKIAKLVGQVYRECGLLEKGHTVKVTRADLIAEYVGQTAPKTRRMIEKAMDGVLFIDEAYSLVKGEGVGGGYGAEAINELVESMTDRNGEFAVIAAGYPDDMDMFLRSNAGLEGRFKVFVLEDYTPEELHQILILQCQDAYMELEPALDEKLDMFFANYKDTESKIRQWNNGREVEKLMRQMQHLWFEKPVTETKEDGTIRRILTEEHLPEDMRKYLLTPTH
ncbi:MAG: AAA family ATPase [bacterium]|nr:AAA family ATPase [bacterium]